VSGIYYILRTGIPWRDLPPEFGPWSSVYTRFRRWCASGLWARLLSQLSKGAEGVIRCVDCSHIKVHRDAANTLGGHELQAMGPTKGGLNTKLAAVVDGLGRAVGLSLAPGQQHELRASASLQSHLDGTWAVADRGFDADAFRSSLVRSGALVCIPPKRGRRIEFYFDRQLYRQRHVVGNFFSRIKRLRRIATRYEKLAVTFHGFVCLAAALDWISCADIARQ
jgi:transposase